MYSILWSEVMWPAPWKGLINDLESLRAFLVPESVNRSLKWANIYLLFTVGQALYWRLHLIPSFDYFIITSTPWTGTMSSFLSLRTDFLRSEVPRSWQWIVELALSWNRPWKASQGCFFSSRRSVFPGVASFLLSVMLAPLSDVINSIEWDSTDD